MTATWQVCNAFTAFRGSEAKKAMSRPGLSDRLRGTCNQFAVTNVLTFMLSVPLVITVERHSWSTFVALCSANPQFRYTSILLQSYLVPS